MIPAMKKLTFSVVLGLSYAFIVQAKINYILRELDDPNSDINLNSLQFIRKYGYVGENHEVITGSGNIINVVRIPGDGPPVLLTHGLADTSDSWLLLGPNESLAFLLAKAGYDVWLINTRGNRYSHRHVDKNIPAETYWDFSYEEVATQDVPAVIDHILQETNNRQLYYIGFSQGTTIFFIMGSMKPEYMGKIKHAFLLAPVASIGDCKYIFIDKIARNLDKLSSLTKSMGLYQLFPFSRKLKEYHATVCRRELPEKVLCELEYYISFGIRKLSNINQKSLPVVASHTPAGASTKSFIHYIQFYKSKRFHRYDYGSEQNQIIYGSSSPPEYNLSLVSAPVSIFMSETDIFSTMKDFELIKNKLPNIASLVIYNTSLEFTHLEFAYGSRVKKLVNEPILEMLQSLR